MGKLLEAISVYQKARGIKHEVAGAQLRFYRNRVCCIPKVRELTTELWPCIDMLFIAKNEGDREAGTEFFSEESDGEQRVVQKNSIGAVALDVVQYRDQQRRDSIKKLLDLFDEPSMLTMGELLMDSLRDEFDYQSPRSPSDVHEFLYDSGMDTEVFLQLVTGWAKANFSLFGEAGKRVMETMKTRLEEFAEETAETSGSSLKTASPSPSAPDTPATSSSD